MICLENCHLNGHAADFAGQITPHQKPVKNKIGLVSMKRILAVATLTLLLCLEA